jgi:hypothetical protein
MTPGKADKWEGHVYNAENGKGYTARVELKGPDELRIEGCLIRGFICLGETWTRTARLDSVGSSDAATPAPAAQPAPAQSQQGRRQSQKQNSQPRAAAVPGAPMSSVCAAVANLGPGPTH